MPRIGVNDLKAATTVASEDENNNLINPLVFIKMANKLVDKVESADSNNELDDDDLVHIETLLACHFYHLRDQRYKAEREDTSSAQYHWDTGMYFDGTEYGQMAKLMDVTGYLANLQDQTQQGGAREINVQWLGKKYETEQIEYRDRD